MKPTARRRLGKYVLLGRIGHGGMGKIYLAHAPGPAGIEKLLVVKRLHSHLTGDPMLVSSFLDEARLSMALNHPNIGHTFDVGEVDGRYFMVMEYIDGQNLGVVLRIAKRSGSYPKSTLWAGLFLSVLDGLQAAHTARDARGRPLQIIHRDVSPQNILVTYDGLPKLVDFGIAKAAMRVQETDAGTLKGKYAYMSPEQVRGEPLDARSDVFAAGIVLWEMLAGRRLYKAETIVRSVERVLQEPPISPVRVNAECSPDLAKVCLKSLAKDRNQRFASADEFKDALEDGIVAAGDRFKPAQVKELMQQLFKDVIEKQRAVLETCLNQQGEIKDDDDDDGKRGDSALDLPRLALQPSELAGDPPTPSPQRSSALITAEGDGATSAPQLRPALAAPPAQTQEQPKPASGSTPSTSALVVAPLPASVTKTSTVVPLPKPRSLLVPVVAALCGVLIAVVVVLGIDARRRSLQGEDEAVTVRSPRVDDAGVAAADVGLIVASLEELRGEAPEAVDDLADGGSGSVVGAAEPAAGETRHPRKRRDPPRRAEPIEKPVERAVEPAHPETPIPAPKGGDDVDATGFLTLDTVPWTTVFLGKKKLGETPLVRVAVPAGNLELTLVNSDANLREAYLARVRSGETFKARLDLR